MLSFFLVSVDLCLYKMYRGCCLLAKFLLPISPKIFHPQSLVVEIGTVSLTLWKTIFEFWKCMQRMGEIRDYMDDIDMELYLKLLASLPQATMGC